MSLILIGHKASGKTFLGRRLAKSFGLSFTDTDEEISKLYKSLFDEEKSIPAIYRKLKEERFRDLERKAVLALREKPKGIIATGAGVLLRKENLLPLQELGTLVFLRVAKKILKKRVFSQELPPFLQGEEDFENSFTKRQASYENAGAISIDCGGKNAFSQLETLTRRCFGL